MSDIDPIYQESLARINCVLTRLKSTLDKLEGVIVREESTGENAGSNKAVIMIFAYTEGELAALKYSDLNILATPTSSSTSQKTFSESDNYPYCRRWPPWAIDNYKYEKLEQQTYTFSKKNDNPIFSKESTIDRQIENIRAKIRFQIEKKEKEKKKIEDDKSRTTTTVLGINQHVGGEIISEV